MHTSVHRPQAVVDYVLVEDGTLDELHEVGFEDVLKVLDSAGAQVVQDEHAVAARGERVDQV